jgi:hypothetical protein
MIDIDTSLDYRRLGLERDRLRSGLVQRAEVTSLQGSETSPRQLEDPESRPLTSEILFWDDLCPFELDNFPARVQSYDQVLRIMMPELRFVL